MKVFIIEPHREYTAGSALVAANSEEEAKTLFIQEDKFNELFYEDCRCSCKEIEGLTYEGKDIILSDTLYME